MSIQHIAEVFRIDLVPNGKMVLLVLADFADEHGNVEGLTMAALARLVGLSEQTTQQVLDGYEDDKVVSSTAPGAWRIDLDMARRRYGTVDD